MRIGLIPLLCFLLTAPVAAEIRVSRLEGDAAADLAARRTATKAKSPASRLLLPFFRVDTGNPDGENTFFAIRNESANSVEIQVRYYASDRPHAPQFTPPPQTLTARQVVSFAVSTVPDLVTDFDGFATGYATIETLGGEAVLHGDTFQLNPDQAFATGQSLLDISANPQGSENDLCSVFTARFLNGGGFDGGTLLNIWLDAAVQPDPAEPILFYTVYNQAGDLRFVGQLAADQCCISSTGESAHRADSHQFRRDRVGIRRYGGPCFLGHERLGFVLGRPGSHLHTIISHTIISTVNLGKELDMSEVVYTAKIRIERRQGPLRHAHLPAEPEPVLFGVHGAIAEHYGVSPEVSDPHATTIDYVIAATGG